MVNMQQTPNPKNKTKDTHYWSVFDPSTMNGLPAAQLPSAVPPASEQSVSDMQVPDMLVSL